MSNPIKLGIVGLGRAGWGMHTGEIQNKTDKYQVAAVCDIIPERVEKSVNRFNCKGYSKIEDLIADPEVEIVDIATRSCDHYRHAKMALLAGKSVLLEKPVSMNIDESTELFTLANQPGKPRLFIRQNRRFEKVFNLVRDTIASGKLGTVFEVSLDVLGYQRRDDWQTLREFGGGQVLNWGPHIIDQSLMLLDSPVKYQFGDMKHAVAGGDCEDHFTIHFVGENGRKVNMCISGAIALGDGRHYTAWGNRGAIMCEENHVRMRYIDPEQVFEPVVSDPGTPGDSFGASGTFSAVVEPKWIEEDFFVEGEDLTVIWDYMYDSFRNGAEYPIREQEVKNLMQAVTRLFNETETIDCTAHRDSVK